jgi:hypothetical protein
VPAAAVIPAPIAYIDVVAVKKLVVGSRRVGGGSFFDGTAPWGALFLVGGAFPLHPCISFGGGRRVLFTECRAAPSVSL